MAGWEKEKGRWFQHVLVGIPFDPILLKCLSYHFHILVAKIREMLPEADGKYMGFKRKGAEEKMS